ncbi:MAG TPA: hypothetical protein VF912_07845 [Anaeromyxobacter sp.]
MIDATPRELPQQRQGGRTGFPLLGWKGILFGLPFAGMGAFLALVTARPGRDAPAGLVKAFGAMFFVAGAALILGGVRYYWREWRRAERLARHRSEPWRADYAWDPRGIAGDVGRSAGSAFLSSTVAATFLAPFNYIAFVDPRLQVSGIWAMRSIVAVLDLAVAASFGRSAYLLARRLEYGRTFLHFGRFPFLLGETVDVRLAPPRHARGLQELEVTLRCIEERIQETRYDRESTTYVARRQMWADIRTVQAAQLAGAGLMLSFDLPREPGLGSDLSATPPRYWELSVKAAAPGVDFASTFLVPVYAHPGSVQLPA